MADYANTITKRDMAMGSRFMDLLESTKQSESTSYMAAALALKTNEKRLGKQESVLWIRFAKRLEDKIASSQIADEAGLCLYDCLDAIATGAVDMMQLIVAAEDKKCVTDDMLYWIIEAVKKYKMNNSEDAKIGAMQEKLTEAAWRLPGGQIMHITEMSNGWNWEILDPNRSKLREGTFSISDIPIGEVYVKICNDLGINMFPAKKGSWKNYVNSASKKEQT